MLDFKTLEALVTAVSRAVPDPSPDLRRNLHAALSAACDRAGLVTREELEVQEAVLARTRERLRALEERLAVLEAQLSNK